MLKNNTNIVIYILMSIPVLTSAGMGEMSNDISYSEMH